MKRARVILADDHTFVLDAIKNMVPTEFEIVGTFADGKALVDGAGALNPDVVVLDIGMPRMNGIIAGELLKTKIPAVKLIYVTMNEDPDLAAEAFELGASGYLLKTSAGSELADAIRIALSGGRYVTPVLTDYTDEYGGTIFKRSRKPNRLTTRQQEILQLLAEGLTMKGVAYKLDLSPRTVAFHKYTMMRQLNLTSSAELIQFGLEHAVVARHEFGLSQTAVR